MTTTAASILSQIKSFEVQLAGLRIQVEKWVEQENGGPHTVADMRGKLRGIMSSSEEDIDSVLYRLTSEQEDEIATLP